MSRIKQAREAAAAVNREFATDGHLQCAAIIMTGAFDEEEDVRVARRASEMERDRIVAWLHRADKTMTGPGLLPWAAEQIGYDAHHKETNDGK